MTKRLVVPDALRAAADAAQMSAAIAANGFLFLTGSTGGDAAGHMPEDPGAQMRNALDKIAVILAADGLGMDAVVEMTSYHIGLRGHFDLFDRIRQEYFDAPFPAWTAIEAGGLRRAGAIIEIRVIAAL